MPSVDERRSDALALVRRFADPSDATALITADGRRLSDRDVADRIGAMTRRLGGGRRLVLIVGENRVDTVVAYLAALSAGHVALLADAKGADRLTAVYDPDTVVADGRIHVRHATPVHELHPDLALLLSTSGSTGNPKLVRLSRRNLDANAHAIADYLALGPDDTAITALPLQYCYGLSVIHSHLVAGGAVSLAETSVVDGCFWAQVARDRVTNVAGVPHSFDLMEASGAFDRLPSSVRFLTQAGGRMDPDRIVRVAERGRAAGFELFVMYGQTEATARMAYLPPDLAASRPNAVGLAVPGGSFRIDPLDADAHDFGPLATGTTSTGGELVYEGANVMMGYAGDASDLARGPDISELRTGDLARIAPDGLVEITGRVKDILKVFGVRIDLGDVRRLLDGWHVDAAVTGDDEGLAIGVLDGNDPADVRARVAAALAVPVGSVAVTALDELPRLGNGKADLRAVHEAARADHANRKRVATRTDAETRADAETGTGDATRTGDETVGAAGDQPAGSGADGTVAAAFAVVLDRPVGPADTFVSLGGDSLSYIEASVRLEAVLGRLPDGWHLTPVGELQASATSAGTPGRRRGASLETSVVLRALSIVLIVGNHSGAFLVGGGAHVLFAVAGFNFSRFTLPQPRRWGAVARLAVPSIVIVGFVAAVTEDFDIWHGLMLHGWFGGRGRWAYWFVEVLLQTLVVALTVLAVPAIRDAERRHRFWFPMAALVPALAVRFDVIDLGTHHRPFFRPHEIAWIFLLGWAAAAAPRWPHRLLVSAAMLASVPGFFGDPLRDRVLLVGLLVIVWSRAVRLPRVASRAVSSVASASLYIYLTHRYVYPVAGEEHPVLGLALAVAAGIVVATAADRLTRQLRDGRAALALRRRPVPPRSHEPSRRRRSGRALPGVR